MSLELRLPGSKVSLELLVEVVDEGDDTDATILAYDAFLAGWCLADPRLARQSDRPVVVLVCPNVQAALSCARRADELLRARLGSPAQPAERWRYPARERVLVAVENAIHHGERAMLALPPLPFAGQFQVVELLGCVMDADTYPSITPLGADRVQSDADDDLFIPTEQLLDLQSRIGQLSRRLTRVGASPVQLVDTGRRSRLTRHRSPRKARAPPSGTGRSCASCTIRAGRSRVEPCVPMSERQRRAPRRGACALRGMPDGAPAKADVHRARTRNRAHDPARIVLPAPTDRVGLGRGRDPTRADRGDDPNRRCRRRATAARSWRAVHRHRPRFSPTP